MSGIFLEAIKTRFISHTNCTLIRRQLGTTATITIVITVSVNRVDVHRGWTIIAIIIIVVTKTTGVVIASTVVVIIVIVTSIRGKIIDSI